MINILIIDDDKDICVVLSKFLKKNNYEVDVAHNAADALKQIRSVDYALVLCDYRLPDMTGVEALQKIKLLSRETAVIIITAYSDVKTAVETIKYGANDYVTKPLYPDELLITIRETIATAGLKSAGEISVVERTGALEGDTKSNHLPIHFITGESVQ